MTAIDVHAHIVPADFPAMPACGCDRWPGIEHAGSHAEVTVGGRAFRRIDSKSWDVPRRVADMDRQDVGIQALSPMPELLSYWIDAAPAVDLCRHVNGAIAAMIAAAPPRFAGLGMVPLQDPELAARELSRLQADGLHGVEIGSNILGRSPGDAMFDPFYAEAERLGLAIFVHALHPAATDRLVGPAALGAFVGFPTDSGLAAASFITGRTLEKFPGLRIGFSHGGGTLAALLPRLQHGWTIMPELGAAFADPTAAAQRMYYDNLVFDPGLLAHLVATFGDTQVFAGSDYPFLAGRDFPGAPMLALAADDATRDRLLHGNARRFLGLA